MSKYTVVCASGVDGTDGVVKHVEAENAYEAFRKAQEGEPEDAFEAVAVFGGHIEAVHLA